MRPERHFCPCDLTILATEWKLHGAVRAEHASKHMTSQEGERGGRQLVAGGFRLCERLGAMDRVLGAGIEGLRKWLSGAVLVFW